MLVVADSSPLHYLILIGAVEVLPKFYGSIVIPSQVLRELQHPRAPESVQNWAADLPTWVEIRDPKFIDRRYPLHEGEAASIALVKEIGADRLLIDDRDGRRWAAEMGIPISGTLAILKDVAIAGHLDLRDAIERLKTTNFRVANRIVDQVLRDFESNPRC